MKLVLLSNIMESLQMSDKKEAGKGDKPRPIIVDRETFDDNWEKTFGKKEEEKKD